MRKTASKRAALNRDRGATRGAEYGRPFVEPTHLFTPPRPSQNPRLFLLTGIHEFADSQFGHVFARGPTREAARKSLVLTLKQMEV